MSGTVGDGIRRGLIAGTFGGALMSISTNVEMRVRRRPPSRVPAEAIERLLSINLGKRAEERLVTVGHVVTSAALGVIRGLLTGAGATAPVANAIFAATAFLPDFALMPALGTVEAPWRWRPVELATSAIHHAVYACGTIAAYTAIEHGSRD
jgi:hypothetical protein